MIFDCDDVLVETETISNRVLAAAISEAGLPMEPEQVAADFETMLLDDIAAAVEGRLGRRLPEGWIGAFEARREFEFRKGVVPVPGVAAVLDRLAALAIPFCVASQARVEKMELTLGLSGLIDRFDRDVLFSARMVARGKPDPDLFLFAAREMGCESRHCAVIEDGVPGARAGRLAGMPVFGYAPSGDGERLAREGATVFGSMPELPALLGLSASMCD